MEKLNAVPDTGIENADTNGDTITMQLEINDDVITVEYPRWHKVKFPNGNGSIDIDLAELFQHSAVFSWMLNYGAKKCFADKGAISKDEYPDDESRAEEAMKLIIARIDDLKKGIIPRSGGTHSKLGELVKLIREAIAKSMKITPKTMRELFPDKAAIEAYFMEKANNVIRYENKKNETEMNEVEFENAVSQRAIMFYSAYESRAQRTIDVQSEDLDIDIDVSKF